MAHNGWQIAKNGIDFSFPRFPLQQMGEGEHFILRFTGPLASSGVANPSPRSHSSFWVLAYSPSFLSSLQKLTHLLIPSLSFSLSLLSTLLFPIWPPGRCVALEQALLIEHLFRHGAGSVACGRAAGGSSRGDIMSYYISWDVSFTCIYAHFTGTHSHRKLRNTNTCHRHPAIIILVSILLVLMWNPRLLTYGNRIGS